MGKFKQVLQHHPNSSNFEYQYVQSHHISKKLHQSMMILNLTLKHSIVKIKKN